MLTTFGPPTSEDRATSIVECRSLRRIIGGRTILADINLRVEPGERVCVLGESGCGKTTLLRTVSGLDPPESGTVLLNGLDVWRVPPKDRRIGMLFQRASVYPHMTVAANLAFPLRCAGESLQRIQVRIAELAEMLALESLLKQQASTLSGGEMQRVALGKALAPRPQLLLLDEPFSSLDRGTKWTLLEKLRDLQKAMQLTAIMVTHDPEEAALFGDRLAFMTGGRIVQTGPVDLLASRPGHRDVARTLLTPKPNFLIGTIRQAMDGTYLHCEGAKAGLRVNGADVTPGPCEVIWRIRDGVLWSSEPHGQFQLHGQVVDSVAFAGSGFLVLQTLEGNRVWVPAEVEPTLRLGDYAYVTVNPREVFLYDSAKGNYIGNPSSEG